MPRSVVVTGASSGIGLAAARALLARGFRVFGTVRTASDACRLTAALGPAFAPLVLDITDEASVAAAATAVRAALGNATLAGLVNNAGIAVPGALLALPLADFQRQLAVNVTGTLIVTRGFAPLLGTEPGRTGAPGRIVMLSSVGGTMAWPFLGAYHTSKFALEGLSEALRREMLLFGIDVIIIRPGPVATPIWEKTPPSPAVPGPYAAASARLHDAARQAGKRGLDPGRIGEAVAIALTARRPKAIYTLTPNRLLRALLGRLPKRAVDRLVAARFGLRPPR